MARGDRICFVDKAKYHYCPGCGGNPEETWRFLFCSHNCWDIEKVWEEYCRDGLITKEEAQARLKQLDTSRIAFYRDQIRDSIIELLKEPEESDKEKAVAKNKKMTAMSERKKKIK